MNAVILPPHSVEAEQSVIGGILLEGITALDRIEGILTADDFYRAEHRDIFAAARQLANAGKPVDVITVAEALDASGRLEDIGGMAYLGGVAQNTPTAANIASYARIVKDKAQLRRLLALGSEITAACLASGADGTEIVSRADSALVQLLNTGTDEPTTLPDAIADAISDIDDRQTGHKSTGLQTGLADLDRALCGIDAGQLVICAARPSVGKTAFGVTLVDHIVERGGSVAFFSLEMTRREVAQRLLALRAGVSVADMRSGKLSDDQWDRMSACQAEADIQRLYIIDRAAIGVPYIRAVSRGIKRRHGLSLIVLDYIGLMRGEGRTRNEEIGSISRGLKAVAKELNVPVLALSQLNRGVEGRLDKRPLLSDLRDSGELEQDCDICLMLHREELYDSDPRWHGIAEALIRKNRNGAIGEVTLHFNGEQMRFANHAGQNPRYCAELKTPRQRPKGGFNDD